MTVSLANTKLIVNGPRGDHLADVRPVGEIHHRRQSQQRIDRKRADPQPSVHPVRRRLDTLLRLLELASEVLPYGPARPNLPAPLIA